jgi:hypothetical protein
LSFRLSSVQIFSSTPCSQTNDSFVYSNFYVSGQ